MKISNSKKKLARIISENGGWRDWCDFVVQDKDSWVCFYEGKPTRCGDCWEDKGDCQYRCGFTQDRTIQNWHQTILSRAEYFHLYPVPDAKPEFCESVMRTIPEPEAKPTIEQLAADYRNTKDYADRKQQEADDAKADAEAKLAELVAAGKALGLVIKPLYIKGFAEELAAKSIVDHKRSLEADQEINITDWRRLHAGDVIWLDHGVTRPSGEYEIKEIEKHEETCRAAVMWNHVPWWTDLDKIDWRFIRRP